MTRAGNGKDSIAAFSKNYFRMQVPFLSQRLASLPKVASPKFLSRACF